MLVSIILELQCTWCRIDYVGHNPMDIAQSWADPRCLDVVQKKWDSMPPPGDKKKKGAKKGSGGPKAKRPSSAPGEGKETGSPLVSYVLLCA